MLFRSSAYAASKGGDLSLMRQMSLDFAADNIRVVSVNPGAIDTPMVRNAIAGTGGDLEEELISTGKAHPLGCIGQTEDIANMQAAVAKHIPSEGFMNAASPGVIALFQPNVVLLST